MSKEDVKVFKNRRSARYAAMMDKIDDFIDTADFYKNKEAKKTLQDVKKFITSNTTKKNKGTSENQTTTYYYDLNVEENQREDFLNMVISDLREAQEDLIEMALRNIKKDLKETYLDNAIEEIEENQRDKYENAIKLLVHLAKIKKINLLEQSLFEITKDIRAIFEYDNKIKAIADYENSEELTDDFVENCINEEMAVV